MRKAFSLVGQYFSGNLVLNSFILAATHFFFRGQSVRLLQQTCAALLVLLYLLVPLSASAQSMNSYDELQARVEVTDNKYRIGPGDVLSMQVYHHPDYNQGDILVRPDGSASFNSVGELLVDGKTVEEIARTLESQISDLVVNPHVTLTVSRTRPAIVYLAGAVMHPGMYQMTTDHANGSIQEKPGVSRFDMRLSNVLANAGGVQLNADLHNVEVRRGNTGEVQRVNLWRMLKEGNRNEDILVQSGDTIYVPQGATVTANVEDYNMLLRSSVGPGTFPIRIIGEVNTPGLYELNGISPNLNSAIARAGGYTLGAYKKKVAIRRFMDGNNVATLYVNPLSEDIVLYPNDVIYVPENRTYVSGRFLEQAAKVLSPFSAATSIGYGLAGIFGFGGFTRWR